MICRLSDYKGNNNLIFFVVDYERYAICLVIRLVNINLTNFYSTFAISFSREKERERERENKVNVISYNQSIILSRNKYAILSQDFKQSEKYIKALDDFVMFIRQSSFVCTMIE